MPQQEYTALWERYITAFADLLLKAPHNVSPESPTAQRLVSESKAHIDCCVTVSLTRRILDCCVTRCAAHWPVRNFKLQTCQILCNIELLCSVAYHTARDHDYKA